MDGVTTPESLEFTVAAKGKNEADTQNSTNRESCIVGAFAVFCHYNALSG